MTNKTCGECRNFKSIRCGHSEASHPVCCAFNPKMTNGDKIRQGGNRALAEFQQHLSCTNCVYFSVKMAGQEFCHKPDDKTCTDGIVAWLNSPAESEGEDE